MVQSAAGGEMFDSAGGNIPPAAQIILLPSDGIYAKHNPTILTRFPAAKYQTYSAVGEVPATWIDVEPGCVWPERTAVDKYHLWQGNGLTRGFYCSRTTKPIIESLLSPVDTPEWFEADPTNIPHVLPGDAETQWGWFGAYDETELAAAPVIKVAPQPTQLPPIPEEWSDMTMVTNPDGTVTISGNDKATGDLLVISGRPGSSTGWAVINVTAAVKAEAPNAPAYQLA